MIDEPRPTLNDPRPTADVDRKSAQSKGYIDRGADPYTDKQSNESLCIDAYVDTRPDARPRIEDSECLSSRYYLSWTKIWHPHFNKIPSSCCGWPTQGRDAWIYNCIIYIHIYMLIRTYMCCIICFSYYINFFANLPRILHDQAT